MSLVSEPPPRVLSRIAEAIADSDEYPGYWADLNKDIARSGFDLSTLIGTRNAYLRNATAAFSEMHKFRKTHHKRIG